MKRMIAGILCLIMTVSFCAGCSDDEVNQTEKETTGLEIAIVTSPAGIDDGSFNENIYNGILSFIDANPDAQVTPIREETGDVAEAVKTVENIVEEYDVIVCCGFQFAGIGELAQNNPEVDFILIDTNPTDAAGIEVELDNIYAMTFKEQESGFCAGLAAALETKTEKVAIVNGIAYPTNVNYQYGFESGVNYANKHYGTNAQVVEINSYAGIDVTGANVGGNYVGNFFDEAAGKVIGEALIAEGVDIIFVAAGAAGKGVFEAAKEADDVFCIGCYVDQYDEGAGENRNIILTSVLKKLDTNVKTELNAIKDGTFAGGNVILGADTESTGYISVTGRHQLSKASLTKMEETFEKVKTGEIVPAANFNGLTPESFTGL